MYVLYLPFGNLLGPTGADGGGRVGGDGGNCMKIWKGCKKSVKNTIFFLTALLLSPGHLSIRKHWQHVTNTVCRRSQITAKVALFFSSSKNIWPHRTAFIANQPFQLSCAIDRECT